MATLRRLLVTLFALAGAALCSQFPEFYQQYMQRLGGRLDEVNAQIGALDERAAQAGMDRYAYVRRFVNNSDDVIHREGVHMVDLLGRQVDMANAFVAMRDSPGHLKPLRFAEHAESYIWEPTARDFEPAVPLTISGALYAAVGALLGIGLSGVLGGSGRLVGRMVRGRRRHTPARREF